MDCDLVVKLKIANFFFGVLVILENFMLTKNFPLYGMWASV